MEEKKASCLVLTALEQYWPTDKHIVFLGDWCQKYSRKAYWEKLDYEVAPNIWEDPNSIREFDEYCLDLIDRLIVALADTLNEFHGENHSVSYWRIILIYWLYRYINEWNGHYQELANALERYPDIEIPILDCQNIQHPLSKDKIYKKNGKKGDDIDLYHFHIYSQILNSLAQERPLRVHCCDVEPDTFIEQIPSRNRRLRMGIRRTILQIIYRIFFKKTPILCYDFHVSNDPSKLWKSMIGKVCFLKTERAPIKESGQDLYDLELRKRININFHPQNEFEKIVLENIIYDLPVINVERYKELVKFRKKKYNFAPKVVILPGTIAPETAVYVAEWMERGVDIYCMAHSPADSMFKKNYDEAIFLANCKKFLWGDAKDIRIRFCPAFKTYDNEVKKIPISRKESILWCCNSWGRVLRYFVYTFPPYRDMKSRQSLIDNVKSCIESLNQELSKKIVFRPRDPGEYGITELFRELIPNVKVDLMMGDVYIAMPLERTSLYDRLDESRVVICESLLTSVFYEVLFANIPVIVIGYDIYTGMKDYLYDDVLSYFYELRRVGIWYENGYEAAEFLNDNYETLESWWLEPERQKVRKKMLDRFFMSTDHLAEWWEKEFDKLLDQRTARVIH